MSFNSEDLEAIENKVERQQGSPTTTTTTTTNNPNNTSSTENNNNTQQATTTAPSSQFQQQFPITSAADTVLARLLTAANRNNTTNNKNESNATEENTTLNTLVRDYIASLSRCMGDDVVSLIPEHFHLLPEKFKFLQHQIGLVVRVEKPETFGESDGNNDDDNGGSHSNNSDQQEMEQFFKLREEQLKKQKQEQANNNNTSRKEKEEKEEEDEKNLISLIPFDKKKEPYAIVEFNLYNLHSNGGAEKIGLPSSVLHAAIPTRYLKVRDRGISALDTVLHVPTLRVGSVGGFSLRPQVMPIQFPESIANYVPAISNYDIFENENLGCGGKEEKEDEENNFYSSCGKKVWNETLQKNVRKLHCTDLLPANPYRRTVGVVDRETLRIGFVDDSVSCAVILLDNGGICVVSDIESLESEMTKAPDMETKKRRRHADETVAAVADAVSSTRRNTNNNNNNSGKQQYDTSHETEEEDDENDDDYEDFIDDEDEEEGDDLVGETGNNNNNSRAVHRSAQRLETFFDNHLAHGNTTFLGDSSDDHNTRNNNNNNNNPDIYEEQDWDAIDSDLVQNARETQDGDPLDSIDPEVFVRKQQQQEQEKIDVSTPDEENNNNNNNNSSSSSYFFDPNLQNAGLPVWSMTKPTLGWFRKVVVPHHLVDKTTCPSQNETEAKRKRNKKNIKNTNFVMLLGEPDWNNNKERGYDEGTIICLTAEKIYVRWCQPNQHLHHHNNEQEQEPAVVEIKNTEDLFVIQHFYSELLGVDYMHDVAFVRPGIKDRQLLRNQLKQEHELDAQNRLFNHEEIETSIGCLNCLEVDEFYQKLQFPENVVDAGKNVRKLLEKHYEMKHKLRHTAHHAHAAAHPELELTNTSLLLQDEHWRTFFGNITPILKQAVRVVDISSAHTVTWADGEKTIGVPAPELMRPDTQAPGTFFDHISALPRDVVYRTSEISSHLNVSSSSSSGVDSSSVKQQQQQQQQVEEENSISSQTVPQASLSQSAVEVAVISKNNSNNSNPSSNFTSPLQSPNTATSGSSNNAGPLFFGGLPTNIAANSNSNVSSSAGAGATTTSSSSTSGGNNNNKNSTTTAKLEKRIEKHCPLFDIARCTYPDCDCVVSDLVTMRTRDEFAAICSVLGQPPSEVGYVNSIDITEMTATVEWVTNWRDRYNKNFPSSSSGSNNNIDSNNTSNPASSFLQSPQIQQRLKLFPEFSLASARSSSDSNDIFAKNFDSSQSPFLTNPSFLIGQIVGKYSLDEVCVQWWNGTRERIATSKLIVHHFPYEDAEDEDDEEFEEDEEEEEEEVEEERFEAYQQQQTSATDAFEKDHHELEKQEKGENGKQLSLFETLLKQQHQTTTTKNGDVSSSSNQNMNMNNRTQSDVENFLNNHHTPTSPQEKETNLSRAAASASATSSSSQETEKQKQQQENNSSSNSGIVGTLVSNVGGLLRGAVSSLFSGSSTTSLDSNNQQEKEKVVVAKHVDPKATTTETSTTTTNKNNISESTNKTQQEQEQEQEKKTETKTETEQQQKTASTTTTTTSSSSIPATSVQGTFQTCSRFSAHLIDDASVTFSPSQPQQFVRRLMQEVKSLRSNPKMTDIFVKINDDRSHTMKFAILGAVHTPYYNGFYCFDLILPANFPTSPPQVKFHARNMRLNPNLYEDGHVCLSLLGTWNAGHKCEQWNASSSTLRQVLLSIQAIILCQEPFYNEAGFDVKIGTPEGQAQSRLYNENTFLLKISHLMHLAQQHPPDWAFEFREHYKKVVPRMLVRFRKYLASSASSSNSSAAAAASASSPTVASPQQQQQQQGTINADGLVFPFSEGLKRSLANRSEQLEKQYNQLTSKWQAEMDSFESAAFESSE